MFRCFAVLVFMLWTSTLASISYGQAGGPFGDPIVIKVIDLDHAEAHHLASILRPFLSEKGRLIPYGPTNTLILKDRRSRVNELVKAIKGTNGCRGDSLNLREGSAR